MRYDFPALYYCFSEIVIDLAPIGMLFNKFANLTIYYILYIQASYFYSVPYLKRFGSSQLEFEMVELYKNKVKFA